MLLAARPDRAAALEASFGAAGLSELALEQLGTFTDDGLLRVGYEETDAVHTELLYQAWCGFGAAVRRASGGAA